MKIVLTISVLILGLFFSGCGSIQPKLTKVSFDTDNESIMYDGDGFLIWKNSVTVETWANSRFKPDYVYYDENGAIYRKARHSYERVLHEIYPKQLSWSVHDNGYRELRNKLKYIKFSKDKCNIFTSGSINKLATGCAALHTENNDTYLFIMLVKDSSISHHGAIELIDLTKKAREIIAKFNNGKLDFVNNQGSLRVARLFISAEDVYNKIKDEKDINKQEEYYKLNQLLKLNDKQIDQLMFKERRVHAFGITYAYYMQKASEKEIYEYLQDKEKFKGIRKKHIANIENRYIQLKRKRIIELFLVKIVSKKVDDNAELVSSISELEAYKKDYPKSKYIAKVDLRIEYIKQKQEYDKAKTIYNYKKFIKKYPKSYYVKAAKDEIKRLRIIEANKVEAAAYESAKGSIKALKRYLKLYKNGHFVKEAKKELAKLEQDKNEDSIKDYYGLNCDNFWWEGSHTKDNYPTGDGYFKCEKQLKKGALFSAGVYSVSYIYTKMKNKKATSGKVVSHLTKPGFFFSDNGDSYTVSFNSQSGLGDAYYSAVSGAIDNWNREYGNNRSSYSSTSNGSYSNTSSSNNRSTTSSNKSSSKKSGLKNIRKNYGRSSSGKTTHLVQCYSGKEIIVYRANGQWYTGGSGAAGHNGKSLEQFARYLCN